MPVRRPRSPIGSRRSAPRLSVGVNHSVVPRYEIARDVLRGHRAGGISFPAQ
jgi:hypothetical protein